MLFLLVEKLVRYVEDNSRGVNTWSHGHHHHHSKKTQRLDDSENAKDNDQSQSDNSDKVNSEKSTDKKELQKVIDESSDGNKTGQSKSLRKASSFNVNMWGSRYRFKSVPNRSSYASTEEEY